MSNTKINLEADILRFKKEIFNSLGEEYFEIAELNVPKAHSYNMYPKRKLVNAAKEFHKINTNSYESKLQKLIGFFVQVYSENGNESMSKAYLEWGKKINEEEKAEYAEDYIKLKALLDGKTLSCQSSEKNNASFLCTFD